MSAKDHSVEEFVSAILKGDRVLLSKAITLVESTREEHQQKAREVVEACLPSSGNSIRIGITGVPGVGKSTFIDSFGNYLCEQDKKVAVLAIDPSSERSFGSILGDKTRMEKLSMNDRAFIRPSPSGGSLGGVARKTRESILLCEAAGFDIILVETVGVGQSETAVHSMTDFFLLLMLAGAGDELQGIKRGIMEMADAVVITKADGDNEKVAKLAAGNYKSALHLFPATESGWIPRVDICSSLTNTGIDRVWSIIDEHYRALTINSHFQANRKDQNLYWLKESIEQQLLDEFFRSPFVQQKKQEIEALVKDGKMTSFAGATALLRQFKPTSE